MSPLQCRMGRAALGWTTAQLADAAGLGINSINRWEGGADSRYSTVERIRDTLERAGVVFLPSDGFGPGVRVREERR
ncbi:helix-turn-helix domain-containing protein [Methylobacterium aquaticum]|uniref:helix-turn-helix domain-containing protein n=1 Tax=Methylobacterium aquaticum TaxID=270351 RepID=UPI003D177F52